MQRQLILILLLTVSCTSIHDTATIGVSAPLTGPVAQYGDRYLRGMHAALNATNASLNLNVKDDKCDAKHAAMTAKHFNSINHYPLQVVMCGSAAVAYTEHVNPNETVLFVNSIRTRNFNTTHDYIYNLYPSVSAEMHTLANAVHNNYDRAAVIWQHDAYGHTYKNAFVKAFRELGGSVPITAGYDLEGGKDFKTTLEKIQSHDIDAVVNMMAHPRNYKVLLQQAHELRLNLSYYSPYLTENPALLELDNELTNGITYTYPYKPRNASAFQTFARRYRKTYNETVGPYALNGYETILLLKQLRQRCDDTRCMRHQLNTEELNGLGSPITFSNYTKNSPIYIKQVRNGSFTY